MSDVQEGGAGGGAPTTYNRMRAALNERIDQRYAGPGPLTPTQLTRELLFVIGAEIDARFAGRLSAGEELPVELDMAPVMLLAGRYQRAARRVAKAQLTYKTPERTAAAEELLTRAAEVANRALRSGPHFFRGLVVVTEPLRPAGTLCLRAVADEELALVVAELEAFADVVDPRRPS